MADNNYGNTSLRFSFDNEEQKIAYDLLKKVPRKQTQLITALLCNFIRTHNANPYVLESKELNTIIKAYCKTTNCNLSLSADMPLISSEVIKKVKSSSSKKKKTAEKQKAVTSSSPIEQEVIIETPVDKKEKIIEEEEATALNKNYNDTIDDLDDDLDDIDDKTVAMARASLQNFGI